jgi:hypothetical protein
LGSRLVEIYFKELSRGLVRVGGQILRMDHVLKRRDFYEWKSKYGGLEVSEARRLKALEDENSKLKKLLAEAMLDNAVLKDFNSKKW